MAIDGKTGDEKLPYDISREAAKISTLSSGKIDEYEYLTGEEILPSNKKSVIEQAKFTYSPLGKALEKQAKANEDQGKEQIEDHRKQLVESNQLILKRIFILTEIALPLIPLRPLKEQKKYSMNLMKKGLLNLKI